MNIIKTNIDGVLIIEPRLFCDARCYFFESFLERVFDVAVSVLEDTNRACQSFRERYEA